MKNWSPGKKIMVSILAIVLCVVCTDFANDRIVQMEAEAGAVMEEDIEILTGTLVHKECNVSSGETSDCTYLFKVKFNNEQVKRIIGNHSEYMELEVGESIRVYKYKDIYALNKTAVIRSNINFVPWFMLMVFTVAGALIIVIYDIYLIKNNRKRKKDSVS